MCVRVSFMREPEAAPAEIEMLCQNVLIVNSVPAAGPRLRFDASVLRRSVTLAGIKAIESL